MDMSNLDLVWVALCAEDEKDVGDIAADNVT